MLFPLLPEQVQHLPEVASLPPLSPLGPEQEKRRLFATLADVVTKQASTRPVLLVVEDIHWSDESTLEFLLFFARKTAAHRLLLVLTYRSDEVPQPLRSFLAQLDRERLRREVILEPLNQDQRGDVPADDLAGDAFLARGDARCPLWPDGGQPLFPGGGAQSLDDGRRAVRGGGRLALEADRHLAHPTKPAGCR